MRKSLGRVFHVLVLRFLRALHGVPAAEPAHPPAGDGGKSGASGIRDRADPCALVRVRHLVEDRDGDGGDLLPRRLDLL